MKLTEKNTSRYSLIIGVINVLWVTLWYLILRGGGAWTRKMSIQTFGAFTKVSSVALILLSILGIAFAVISIKKSIKGNKKWVAFAIIGIILAVAPLFVGSLIGLVFSGLIS